MPQHEGSIFFNDGDGVEVLKNILFGLCKEICRKEGVPIRIDEYLCAEALARAKETIDYHKVEAYSIYKEVAHVGFWLSRLKPIRIYSPMNVFHVFGTARAALDELLKGYWVKLEAKAQQEEEELREVLDFPVNEHVSIQMIVKLIEAHQLGYADLFGAAVAQDMNNAIVDNQRRYPWLFGNLERTLRNHNHSARGFATLIECTFRTRCEDN